MWPTQFCLIGLLICSVSRFWLESHAKQISPSALCITAPVEHITFSRGDEPDLCCSFTPSDFLALKWRIFAGQLQNLKAVAMLKETSIAVRLLWGGHAPHFPVDSTAGAHMWVEGLHFTKVRSGSQGGKSHKLTTNNPVKLMKVFFEWRWQGKGEWGGGWPQQAATYQWSSVSSWPLDVFEGHKDFWRSCDGV